MSGPQGILCGFRSILPKFQKPQAEALDWLAWIHSSAESVIHPGSKLADADRLRTMLQRFGCKPDRIEKRHVVLEDSQFRDFTQMKIFDLTRDPRGAGSSARNALYSEIVEGAFENFYPAQETPPRALFHVTCTGYNAPSGAEKLVARRGWGGHTEVHLVYHMGCYAAVPALRLSQGFGSERRLDFVHTELCSLHLHPERQDPEQLVIESLFADGMIRYCLEDETRFRTSGEKAGFRVLALRKEILPSSESAMTWAIGDHGLDMTLSTSVPEIISRNLEPFVKKLHEEAFPGQRLRIEAYDFAIHPGGPKVIDQVQEWLKLSDEQSSTSKHVLAKRGNMSSATLPHIWMELLDRKASRRPVISLAFGPGLTLCGAVFERVGA